MDVIIRFSKYGGNTLREYKGNDLAHIPIPRVGDKVWIADTDYVVLKVEYTADKAYDVNVYLE